SKGVRDSDVLKGRWAMSNIVYLLILAAVAFNGILVGASLDQSIKQLPARHRIGVMAYSAYAKASDMVNVIVSYAITGIGYAILILAASVGMFIQTPHATYALSIY